jgi:phosphate uptake regulator
MKNLIDIPDVKINDIVLKIVRALAGMLEDIRTALDTADKAILNDIIERDNEVELSESLRFKGSMNLLEYTTIK